MSPRYKGGSAEANRPKKQMQEWAGGANPGDNRLLRTMMSWKLKCDGDPPQQNLTGHCLNGPIFYTATGLSKMYSHLASQRLLRRCAD